jgi:hypothetical protein
VKSEDLDARLAAGGEFNIELEMEIRQQLKKRGKELVVGRCLITFHCTPKAMAEARRERRANRGKRADAAALPAANDERASEETEPAVHSAAYGNDDDRNGGPPRAVRPARNP